jgi:hypothetical protein
MSANPDAPFAGRPSASETAERLRRVRWQCTTQGNADRLARILETRVGRGHVSDKLLGALLPIAIRAESQVAYAKAADSTDDAHRVAWEQARTLAEWSEACQYESRQQDAVALLKKRTGT